MFLQDPIFAVKVWCGPVYPYTYRLYGPGKWDGAREAILTAMDRVKAPFQTRCLRVENNKEKNFLECFVQGFMTLVSGFLFALMVLVFVGVQ
ncbi:dimethylaniline monooxygenase [N-oxide-forming] [Elysia marginata]|uniref:Flavin-containing monooxygenase n=1 Tax=Elysia marginata TaxID=1093978 RepID=A0AAV4HPI3_9GAST|nr:dimethylaniline monooxygenase [N-oxide-forming] [Elysia marginata]